MIAYDVTALTPSGKVKHTIRLSSKAEAIEKMKRVHPGAAILSAKPAIDPATIKGYRPEKMDRREWCMSLMLDYIPDEGTSVKALSEALGSSPGTVRNYIRDMEATGAITCHKIDSKGTVLIKRAEG